MVHDSDAIGHRHRFFLVVGHEDEGDPDLLLDALELDLHLLAQLQVECAERLVEQQDRRPVDERPGERHTLGLATGQLGRLATLVAWELDQIEHLRDPGPDLRIADLGAPQPESHVLVDRQVREQRVVLEDGVDVPLVRRQPGNVLALELDQAGGRCLEPADHPQRRRLAAAGWAKEREEFPGLDLEVDVVDDHGLAVALDDIDKADVDGRHVRSHSCAGNGPAGLLAVPCGRGYGRGSGSVKKRESR